MGVRREKAGSHLVALTGHSSEKGLEQITESTSVSAAGSIKSYRACPPGRSAPGGVGEISLQNPSLFWGGEAQDPQRRGKVGLRLTRSREARRGDAERILPFIGGRDGSGRKRTTSRLNLIPRGWDERRTRSVPPGSDSSRTTARTPCHEFVALEVGCKTSPRSIGIKKIHR